jgi:AraC-like DNA-binding protein
MSMRYFTPPTAARPNVQSFTILEESGVDFNARILLPDPSPQLIINLGAPLIWEMQPGAHLELPRAWIALPQTRPLHLHATGSAHLIGINLYAWGPRFLVDEGIDLTAAPVIPLDGAWRDLTALVDTTHSRRGDLETIATLAQFVIDYHHSPRADASSLRAAVEILVGLHGECRAHELAARCYLSLSQLERDTKFFTGLSPKSLARLIRFDAACSEMLGDDSGRLTDLAHRLGYMDQAHFNHEFREFAGCTPRQVRQYILRLSANAEFLQFS